MHRDMTEVRSQKASMAASACLSSGPMSTEPPFRISSTTGLPTAKIAEAKARWTGGRSMRILSCASAPTYSPADTSAWFQQLPQGLYGGTTEVAQPWELVVLPPM